MSSLQPLRELISERLAAAAEEIFRLCEGTIVQYEEELCRQRRLLDISWKPPQLQDQSIVLPQHYVNEEEDLCNQPRNLRAEQEELGSLQTEELEKQEPLQFEEEQGEPEPQQIKEEQEEQELAQIEEEQEKPEPPLKKEEQDELCISLDEEQLELKQETDTWMETPTYEEDENSEADLNEQLFFYVTDCQDEESTSNTYEKNRDQRERRDRSHVQNVDCSYISESQSDSDVRKATLVKKHQQSPKENRPSSVGSDESSRIVNNLFVHTKTESNDRLYICTERRKSFGYWSKFRTHRRTQRGAKPLSCNECAKSFRDSSHLKRHMRTHTGEKPFSCKECNTSFSQLCSVKRHMRTHTGEKPFSCKECDTSFSRVSHLKRHIQTHTGDFSSSLF